MLLSGLLELRQSLMTFFFSKSTNCLQQCLTRFKYNDSVMKSLQLFLAKQTSSFLAVIPVRIYDLIRTVEPPSLLPNIRNSPETKKMETLNETIYSCGLLTKSLVLLDMEGIQTREILVDGLQKELYLEIQSVFDTFQQRSNNLLEAINFLDSELTSIQTKFGLIVRHININADELFVATLESLMKWSIGTVLRV